MASRTDLKGARGEGRGTVVLSGAGVGEGAPEDGRLRAQVVRWVRRRPLSVAEVRRQLAAHGTPAAIDRVVESLQAAGVLDDAALARWWVEARASAARPRSVRRIREELTARGVADEWIEAALTRVVPGRDADRLAAARLRDQQARRLRGLPPRVRMQRLWAALGRAGFADTVIEEVLGVSPDESW